MNTALQANTSIVQTSYSNHVCLGQIDHYKQIIILSGFFSFSLFLMQITI